MAKGYTSSTLPSPAGSRMGQAAAGRQDGSPPHFSSLLEVLGILCLQQLALGKYNTKLFTGKKKNKKKNRTSNFLKKSTFEGLPWQFSD